MQEKYKLFAICSHHEKLKSKIGRIKSKIGKNLSIICQGLFISPCFYIINENNYVDLAIYIRLEYVISV